MRSVSAIRFFQVHLWYSPVHAGCVGLGVEMGIGHGRRRQPAQHPDHRLGGAGRGLGRNVLFHLNVDAAVLETARGGILREGLGFDRCDIAVITNIGSGDHLGLSYISIVEDLAVVKRVIVLPWLSVSLPSSSS